MMSLRRTRAITLLVVLPLFLCVFTGLARDRSSTVENDFGDGILIYVNHDVAGSRTFIHSEPSIYYGGCVGLIYTTSVIRTADHLLRWDTDYPFTGQSSYPPGEDIGPHALTNGSGQPNKHYSLDILINNHQHT